MEELNTPIPDRTLTHHRKAAVSFRDGSLLECFTLSVGLLQQLTADALPGASPAQKSTLGEAALVLLVSVWPCSR